MAATDARPIPRKNAAYRVTFPIFDADGDLVTGASALDSEVSIDGGSFTDCTNEATEIATNSGMYYLDLTAAEMNGDTIAVIVKTSTSGAKTTPIVMYPEEAGDIRVDVTQISGDATAADNAESFFDGTGYAGTGNTIPTVTTTANLTTNNDKTGYALTAGERNSIADAWIARVIEGAHTLGDLMRLFASVLTGKSAGGGGATITFRDLADTKNRISATVDANGNRTAVGTRDGT